MIHLRLNIDGFAVALIMMSLSFSSVHSGKDANEWPTKYPEYCGGSSQSPIDIPVNDAVPKTREAASDSASSAWWKFTGYDVAVTGSIHNNGHTVQFDVPTNYSLTVEGGGLEGVYKLAQFHFHWADAKNMLNGSEHAIGGKFYSLEVHLVHFHNSYTDLGAALGDTSNNAGIAVLGGMFQLGDDDNEEIQHFIEDLSHVVNKDGKKDKPILISKLLPSNVDEFYRYMGSLTTPTCNEQVIWTVMKNPSSIGREQLKQFYNLLTEDDTGLDNNFRPVQALNGREVKYYSTTTQDAAGAVTEPIAVSKQPSSDTTTVPNHANRPVPLPISYAGFLLVLATAYYSRHAA